VKGKAKYPKGHPMGLVPAKLQKAILGKLIAQTCAYERVGKKTFFAIMNWYEHGINRHVAHGVVDWPAREDCGAFHMPI
jgi:hypothetical protein